MEEANSWVDACRKIHAGVESRFRVAWSDFTVVEVLSQKDSGSIEIVELLSDHRRFLRKIYQKRLLKDLDAIIESKRELSELINPFVTSLVYLLPPDSSRDRSDQFGLVYEYVTHGCLFTVLSTEGKFSEARVQLYAAEIFLGLFFLHQRKITYRDLAPDCILLMDNGHLKLPDPGLIPLETRKKEYLAPESWEASAPSEAGDWYSFGALVYEMICGYPPFWSDDEADLRSAVETDPLRFPRHVSPIAKDFLVKLLAREPSERLGAGSAGADEIKNHTFFTGLNWSDAAQQSITPEWIPGPNYVPQNPLGLEK
jgi:serine/threonine protein kinase